MRSSWFNYSKILAVMLMLVSFNLAGSGLFNEREYQIKTAFMLNFFKFTQWSTNHNLQLFLFCSTNDDFTKAARKRLESKSVHGKSITVMTVIAGQEKDCDALFVTKYESELWERHLINYQHSNALIIGERAGFAKNIGHIKFFRINNKLRFQVNITSLKKDRIKMSPQLLRLASIVHGRTAADAKIGAKL